MLYAFGFLELFLIGGLTGVFLATLAIDVHLTDTYFVIAHFHYVMVGGTLMGFVGGIHYWFPKMTGRMYPEKPAFWAWLLIIVGFNVTFFPQFILGAQGMPRRYWDYLPEFTFLNRVSTVGSWLLLAGFSTCAVYLWRSIKHGAVAGDNPWKAATLEWQTPSPPPLENFLETPVVTTWAYEYRPTGFIPQNAPLSAVTGK
jgi:cytochrome c oxidase subunit 1